MLKVSVVVPARNAGATVADCVQSVLENQWRDFELLVIDDSSTDDTAAKLRQFADPRLRYLKLDRSLGPAAARNRGLEHAGGELVFFLDADCVAPPDWLSEGVSAFAGPAVIGVEGAVHYAEVNPSLRDKVPINPLYNLGTVAPINRGARDFAAANIAYRRSVLLSVGGFDAVRFPRGREDTDLGIRASAFGRICFCSTMRVTHRRETWTTTALMANAARYSADVRLLRLRGTPWFYHRGIVHPQLLLMLVCPPVALARLRPWLKGWRDWFFLGPVFMYLLLLRLHIWRAAWRERVLVF